MDSISHVLHDIFVKPGSELGPDLVIPRTIIAFAVAVFYVRIAKKRFIAQASAVDLVVAVVFGSMLSRAINGSGTLVSCLSAGLALVVLQRLVDHLAFRFRAFETLVKGTHEALVVGGKPDLRRMAKHDITHDDLLSEMRTNALTDRLEDVELAVLERSGKISIVKRPGFE